MRFSYLSFLLLLILPILLYLVTHGVVISDEGYILNSAEKLYNGHLPYRDFHFTTTPLSLYLTTLSFAIFKSSIVSSRILVLIVYLISSLLIFKTVFIATRNNFYATLSFIIFISWAPSHINYSDPAVYSIITGLLFCYLLMKFMQTRANRYLLLAGVAAFCVILSEQFFGIALFFPVLIFFIVKHARSLQKISLFSYGYIWSFIFFLIYLLINQSFSQFIGDSFHFFFIRNAFIQNSFLQNMLYIIPLIISLASFILLYLRRRFHLLFLPSFVISFFIAGTFLYGPENPALLMSLLGIPIALYLRYNIALNVRLLLITFSFVMIIAGFYSGIFKGYYKAKMPLIENSVFFSNSKVNIFIDRETEKQFIELSNITNKYSTSKDYIFVNLYSPMLYFVLDRKEPIKHSYLYAQQSSKGYYTEVVGNLVAKKVRILLLEKNSINHLPMKNFVQDNYEYLKTIGNLDVYLLRS